jgi:hypothetical protein
MLHIQAIHSNQKEYDKTMKLWKPELQIEFTVVAESFADQRANGQVGHVVVVHYIEVHYVSARGHGVLDFFAQGGHVCTEDGGRDEEVLFGFDECLPTGGRRPVIKMEK